MSSFELKTQNLKILFKEELETLVCTIDKVMYTADMDNTPEKFADTDSSLSHYTALSKVVAATVFLTGIVVLIGWATGNSMLKSILPSAVTMKANTALGFVLSGAALWLLQKKNSGQATKLTAWFFSSIVILIGLATSLEYLFSINLGIDQLLFNESANAILTASPGRMALITAICFMLVGTALLLLDRKTKKDISFSQVIILISGIVPLLAIAGYIYGVPSFFTGLARFTAMAIHTAFLFFIMPLGVLLSRPHEGIMVIFTNNNPSGHIMRRSVPFIFVPYVLGWLKINSDKYGILNNAYGVSLVAISNTTIFLGLLIYAGLILYKKEKVIIEEKKANELQAMIMKNIAEGVCLISIKDATLVYANRVFEKMFGYESREIIGKNASIINAPTNKSPEQITQEIMADVTKDGVWHGEVQSIKKDSRVFWSFSNMSVFDHSEYGPVVVATYADITKIKELAEKLESTLDDFYTMRTRLQKDMELGIVKEENEKIQKRMDEIKKDDSGPAV